MRFSPSYWRIRAEESRTLAQLTDDPKSKESLLRVAEEYELLARRVAQIERQRISLKLA